MKNYKALSIVLAIALVMVCTIGGTLAWLTAKTGTVTNTFTSAELFANPSEQFTLWENIAADEDKDGIYTLTSEKGFANTYDVLPGVDIPKNPTVTVVDLEEHAYLYVEVTGSLPTGMSFEIDDHWTSLGNGIYVYEGTSPTDFVIKAHDGGKVTFDANILKDNTIKVKSNYSGTSDDMSLAFQAYMVQATGNGANAAEAWANTYGA